jgi:hypothetical protein
MSQCVQQGGIILYDEQYLEVHKYGIRKLVEQNLEKVMLTMNKEYCKDHVLTFPAFLAEFVLDLMLTAQGFVMIPGKTTVLYLMHPLSSASCLDRSTT